MKWLASDFERPCGQLRMRGPATATGRRRAFLASHNVVARAAGPQATTMDTSRIGDGPLSGRHQSRAGPPYRRHPRQRREQLLTAARCRAAVPVGIRGSGASRRRRKQDSVANSCWPSPGAARYTAGTAAVARVARDVSQPRREQLLAPPNEIPTPATCRTAGRRPAEPPPSAEPPQHSHPIGGGFAVTRTHRIPRSPD